MAKLKFKFVAGKPGGPWKHQFAALLKGAYPDCKLGEGSVEVEGGGLATAVKVASIAEIAYGGSARFWKEKDGFRVQLKKL